MVFPVGFAGTIQSTLFFSERRFTQLCSIVWPIASTTRRYSVLGTIHTSRPIIIEPNPSFLQVNVYPTIIPLLPCTPHSIHTRRSLIKSHRFPDHVCFLSCGILSPHTQDSTLVLFFLEAFCAFDLTPPPGTHSSTIRNTLPSIQQKSLSAGRRVTLPCSTYYPSIPIAPILIIHRRRCCLHRIYV